MVNSCVSIGCTNRVKGGSGISFHRFPHSNPELLRKWIQAIEQKDCLPNKHSVICSAHFKEGCFVPLSHSFGWTLKHDAVPTEFQAFHKYYQDTKAKRKSPTKTQLVSVSHSPSKIRKTLQFEHSYSSSQESPSKTSKTIDTLSKMVKALKQMV